MKPAARRRPTQAEVEDAVRTLIAWTGDDPTREGLRDTPRRVTDAFEEYFSGYRLDPAEVLARTFDEAGGYDDLVMLRDIRVESHCEHHMTPFLGVAHVAYLPKGRIVGISKIARVVEIFAKRLQTQETMTAQIADAIEAALMPRGVAVLIEAEHQCMSMRGVRQPGVRTITTRFTGAMESERQLPRPLPADGARPPLLRARATGLRPIRETVPCLRTHTSLPRAGCPARSRRASPSSPSSTPTA